MNGFALILKSFPVFRICLVYLLMRLSLAFKYHHKLIPTLLFNKLQINKASDYFYDGLGTQRLKTVDIIKCRSSVDDNLIYRNDSSIYNKISPTVENFIADMVSFLFYILFMLELDVIMYINLLGYRHMRIL